MANTFFRIRYWFTRITTLISLILTIFLHEDFILSIEVLEKSTIITTILSLLTVIAFIVLLIIELVVKSRSVLGQATSIIGLIFVSVLGIMMLSTFPTNLVTALLLGCLVSYIILGSVRTTNSYVTKDNQIKIKNIICNAILIFFSLIMIIYLIVISRPLQIIPTLLILINSILDMFLINMNSSQKYRPFLDKRDANRKDYLTKITKQLRGFWKSVSSVLGGIFAYLIISFMFIIAIIMFNAAFGGETIGEKPVVLNLLFGIQVLLLGFIVFFEVLIHIPLKRVNDSANTDNNILLMLKDLKHLYNKQRPSHLKTIGMSFISSIFLLIGTTLMQFIFNNKWGNYFWIRLGISGIHFIRFIKAIIFPFLAIMFCFVVIILLMGLFSGGWVAKNPISGLLSGLLTSIFFLVWIIWSELGQPKQYAIIVTGLVICPIFGAFAGFLNWFGRGKPGIRNKAKKIEFMEDKK